MNDDMFELMARLIKLKAEGFCCSQIILILALEAQGETNSELVRAMAGLCYGSNAGEVCGALSGGACFLSMYTGKGADEETPDDRHMLMMTELVRWFQEKADSEYGGVRCDDVLEKFPNKAVCGRIVVDTYRKCVAILESHGFNPGMSDHG